MTEEQRAPAASYDDLFDTGPKSSPEADAGATAPVQVQAAPVQVDATPVQVQASPVQVDATPVQVQASPVQVDAVPVQAPAEGAAQPGAPAAEAGGEGMDDALAEFEADLDGDIGPDWNGAEAPADAPPPDPRIEALKRALEAKGFTPERIADVLKMMGRKPLPGSFTKEEAQAPPPEERPEAPAEEPPAQEAAPEEEGGKKKMKKVDPEMLAKLMAEQEAEEAAAGAQPAQEQQAGYDPAQEQQAGYDPAQQQQAGYDPAQQQQAGYTQTPCYNCGAMVDIPPQRPATVVCANCGTQGVIN